MTLEDIGYDKITSPVNINKIHDKSDITNDILQDIVKFRRKHSQDCYSRPRSTSNFCFSPEKLDRPLSSSLINNSADSANDKWAELSEKITKMGKNNSTQPDPHDLTDKRVLDYTVNERLFPVRVFQHSPLKISSIHDSLNEFTETKDAQLDEKSPKKYIRLNFPRHRINHNSCSVVRNNKPGILIRTEKDAECSLSLLANSNKSVKNAGVAFDPFTTRSKAPKNKQLLDIHSAERKNVYHRIKDAQKFAKNEWIKEKNLDASLGEGYALKDDHYFEKFQPAREWLSRTENDNFNMRKSYPAYQVEMDRLNTNTERIVFPGRRDTRTKS